MNGNPSFTDVVLNFGVSDLAKFGGMSALGMGYGYFVGYRNRVQPPMMLAGGVVGTVGGFMLAYQASFGRLLGLTDNGRA